MKKLYIFLAAVLLTTSVFAQAPEKMSYQAVVRDAGNALVASQAVGMQISILQGSATGTAVYVETQTPSTNINGLVSLEIGTGTLVSGDFTTIDWANDTYFIKTETDPSGGTTYSITGTSQLMSVPYALHAKTALSIVGGVTETDPVFGASIANGISAVDTANWNSHTIEVDGSVTETDPVFGASIANGISAVDTANWNSHTIEVDGSVTNEIQAISFSSDTLYLSNGGQVYLGDFSDTLSFIQDVDGDTKIQTEENSNEDIIRFDIAGNETWVMKNNRLEPYNTGKSVFVGENAGASDDNTDNMNVASGYLSLQSNTSGGANTALGGQSMKNNQTGSSNTSVGQNSMAVNTGGSNNVALGHGSLWNNLTGNNNTIVGTQAGVATLGSGNVFVGYNAGQNETGSNNLYIDNSNTTTPLIYGDFNTDSVAINGELSINNAYTLPTTDGTTGQIMTTDGSGNATWVNQTESTTYAIGDFAQGGVVFWVDETGEHGLVCAKTDQSASVRWYAGTNGNTQAKGDGPFAGESNTAIIIAAQVAIGDDGTTYAARICNELQLTEGGKTYGDWYLPSNEELNQMFLNRATINATAIANSGISFSNTYWSSTELSSPNAFYFSFASGATGTYTNKMATMSVRAVRSF